MYRLLLGPRAQRDLDRLMGDTWVRVREALTALARTRRPKGCVKLSTGAWRIRVGEFRVLYDIDDRARMVEVLRVKHRRDVYRGLWREAQQMKKPSKRIPSLPTDQEAAEYWNTHKPGRAYRRHRREHDPLRQAATQAISA